MSNVEGPRVGVVVAAYNAERFVAATLESLRKQTFDGWICLVVDDGSTDATAEVVRAQMHADSRIELLSQANAGHQIARNLGIEALPPSCEYVVFLDSDDVYEPDALEALVELLDRRSDAIGVYGLADYIDEAGEPLHLGLHPSRQRYRRAAQGVLLRHLDPSADATFASLVVDGSIWPPAVAMHRLAAVKAIGGFDPNINIQEDWDLYLRLSRSGPFAVVDRRLAWYRRHRENMTAHGAYAPTVLNQAKVRHKAYQSADNSRQQTRLVARTWRLLQARQAAVLARQSLRWAMQGRVKDSAKWAFGMLLCIAELLLPGPPEPSVWRLSFTRPADHPGVELIPLENKVVSRAPTVAAAASGR